MAAIYEKAASLHGQAMERGDSRIANRQFDIAWPARKELLRRGEEGKAVFLRLLQSPDAGVRYWSAGVALSFAPTQAEPVLEQLAATPGSVNGFSASWFLKIWREGTLSSNDNE